MFSISFVVDIKGCTAHVSNSVVCCDLVILLMLIQYLPQFLFAVLRCGDIYCSLQASLQFAGNFNRHLRNQEFCIRAKRFPTQISH